MRRAVCTTCVVWSCLAAFTALAYPGAERRPATQTQPPLDLGLQTATGYAITEDNAALYVAYGETLKSVNLGSYALASTQPYAIASDTSVSGALNGIAYIASLNKIYATQEGGHLLTFDLTKMTAIPTKVTVVANRNLTLVVADPDTGTLYIYNATDGQIIRYPVDTAQATTIDLQPGIGGNFTVNQMVFVRNISGSTGALYVATNAGRVVAIPSNANAPTIVTLDAGGTHDLKGIAALPNSQAIYVVDATDKTVRKVATASNTQTASISLAANSDLRQIAVTDVTIPTATYGFVVGSKGVSIFNTADHDVFDLGSTATDDEPLAVSGAGPILASTDGYLYLSFGKIAVMTDNPWVTMTKVEYSGGKSTVGIGGTVTLTFEADEAGTYVVRSGGTVAQTGTLLTDTSGATSGTVTAANTAHAVTWAYDTNTAAFSEGGNTVFLFVTDSAGNIGRRSTMVTVDTPPPAPTIQSVSFGTNKLYINLQRLAISDIATYRIYLDTDPAVVATKTTVAGTVAQPAVGSEPTVIVEGLSNKSLYYVAADVVDATGNVSVTRTNTFANGSVASGTPETTSGPAGLSGERGCSLILGVRR